jgi:hypothetical protein
MTSRTHHATRTWRLNCGCLRDYPGMPLNRTCAVLCVACRKSVVTEYAYPERACGHQASVREGSGTVHLCCTVEPGNENCEAGVHYDGKMSREFRVPGKLRASEEGQTRRA